MVDLKRYEKHCDITLVDEETGEKHGMISKFLICESSYFEALLSKNWNSTENSTFKIKLNKAWPKVKEWIFTGRTRTNLCDDVVNIHQFADMYQFDQLMNEVENIINYNLETIIISSPNEKLFVFSQNEISYLLQPQFCNFLFKFRKDIVTHYFSTDPIYTLLSTMVFRETLAANSPLNHAHFAIQSANINYDLKAPCKLKENKDIIVTLLPGLRFRYKSLHLSNDLNKSVVKSFEVFGQNDKDLISLDSNSSSTAFYTKFVIKFDLEPNFGKLTHFVFHGDVAVDFSVFNIVNTQPKLNAE